MNVNHDEPWRINIDDHGSQWIFMDFHGIMSRTRTWMPVVKLGSDFPRLRHAGEEEPEILVGHGRPCFGTASSLGQVKGWEW